MQVIYEYPEESTPILTIYRVPLKEGDTVYHSEKRARGKVLGRLKQWVLLELEGTHEKLKARRGEIKLIHPKSGSGM